ncbi:MAG: PAS domain S-box protein [Deltaproteobacteria bacterium]|nr:PAS domain S-box protein [Deltaproteobacteria bacterium]
MQTPWRQESPIWVFGKREGSLEVSYLEERPERGAGPFLKEERTLLDLLASRLGKAVERKRDEKMLQESELRLRNLVETTSDWIWEVNKDAVYTYASPRIRHLLGYEPEEVIGKTPFDFMPLDERQRVASVFTELIARQESFSGLENVNQRKDGSLVTLETNAVPVFDSGGAFQGYRGVDRNITERKLAQEERDRLILQLRKTLAEVKSLRGIFPICASCKRIRDDKGYWNQIESYIRDHSEAEFTHGICPECMRRLYPDLVK